MAKYFNIPFATSGDKTTIPDTDGSGFVNWTQGYTPDYELDQTGGPPAKDVPRQGENQFKFDVTDAVKEIQEYSVLNYNPSGNQVNYPVGALAVGSDGTTYKAVIANGPDTSVVDPVGDTTGTWVTWVTNYSDMKTGRKNLIINGNFDIWQRGTSTTSSITYLADRWEYVSSPDGGTTNSSSTDRQTFALGQTDVPGNPKYYSRIAGNITGGGGTESLIYRQKVENVSTGSGGMVALSIYMKASSARTVNIDLVQNFGTGGSPSATVYTNIGQASLTTSFQKFTFVISAPSVSGKTLGTNDDDFVEVAIVHQAAAGSSYTTTSSSTSSIDVSTSQFEIGSIATGFEQRSIGEEQALCEDYYTKSYQADLAPGSISTVGSSYLKMQSSVLITAAMFVEFKRKMRASPTVAIYSPTTGAVGKLSGGGADRDAIGSGIGQNGFRIGTSGSVSWTANDDVFAHYTADAEL